MFRPDAVMQCPVKDVWPVVTTLHHARSCYAILCQGLSFLLYLVTISFSAVHLPPT
ncbi:hypothetical protein M378DRAFT_159157 [Amanita muscaria Koide BX008]|uniref:Uncharacterized protein n=1 Tax=Amanita muscaria (strain Koide BX008) TaxID=946122 RepID=A0A0C2X1D0_AMAMK|nr:hypothetical protein M378DRAFT_159157 [Amanita muscaria Koide BX008]